jgi:hypothetical protein
VQSNFLFDSDNRVYTEINKSNQPQDYLFYNTRKSFNFAYNTFSMDQLESYLSLRFSPVNKLEDYLFFSVQNAVNEGNTQITSSGIKIKYTMLFQKYLTTCITFFTILCFIENYKINKK